MVAVKLASAAIAAVSFLASTVAADVDPIVIKGSKFFYKTNGTEFFIKGVAYQQNAGGNGTDGGSSSSSSADVADPLTDSAGCARDIPMLTALHTNTIRVYSINPNSSHDDCMTALANAGIYVLADLGSPDISINQANPVWDDALYARFTSVIDTMSKYSNTLGFFAGNEVVNNITNSNAMPFVKAAARDMKAYIKQKNYRPMGVGYAADDDQTIRDQVRQYINCGPAEDSVDFFGYNIYSFCGSTATFESSGYQDRTEEYANYSVPAFFAEYGCNQPAPRQFDDTPIIYSSKMTGVWSGAIVYEYFEAPNDFGLVNVDGSSVSKLADYTQFSKQIASATPSGVNSASYNPTNTAAQDCPAVGPTWAASSNLPPTPNEQLCSCMVSNLTCVANSDVSDDATSQLFGFICGQNNGQNSFCDGIAANGTTGKYGAFSMCKPNEQLSFAMNNYAAAQNGNSNACSFGGNATSTSANVNSQCTPLLQQAGAAGTGTVTSVPTGTGSIGAGSASSSGAANGLIVPAFDFGVLAVGIYATIAAMVGAGMILL